MSHDSLSKNYAAITYVGDMVPTAGRGAPIAPPTYIANSDGSVFARSEAQPVPTPESSYREFAKDPDSGALVLRPSVVVNSQGAEATRIETAIIENEDLLGVKLPGIFLDHEKTSDEKLLEVATNALKKWKEPAPYDAKFLAEMLRDDLRQAEASTWVASHRHADAYIRHSEIGGKQIWADPDSEVYKIITNASADRADLLFRYFPNSALFGFWLSSVAPRRHKLARSLSSVMTGYDAHDIAYGATKGDVLGGIASEAKLQLDEKTLELREGGKRSPSEFGLGLVPNAPTTKAFSCGSILRQSSVSLSNLRHLKVPGNREASRLIADVLAWLGIFGLLVTQDDNFLRSGCDLVTAQSTSGFKRITAAGTAEDWDIDLDAAIAGFQAAYDRLPEELRFAERIYTEYPEAILAARATTILNESKASKSGEGKK